MNRTLISFVIPCYRSQHTIGKVINEVISTVEQRDEYDYEIVAINDCSPDELLVELQQLAGHNSKIKVLDLAKNMGKHAAVLAGYGVATGKYIVDLDDDQQSPVPELWRLLEPVARGECDYATAKYTKKQQTLWKRVGSRLNQRMSAIMLDKPAHLRFENFSVMHSFVAKEIIKYPHPFPYLEGLVLRVTSQVQTVPMAQRERGDDQNTGFTLSKSLSLWLNGLTAFSVKPLRLASLIGLMTAISGFTFACYIIAMRLVTPETPAGFSSIMAVLLIASGIMMLCLGMIGEYVGRIYICINAAPQSVVKRTWNVTSNSPTPGPPE